MRTSSANPDAFLSAPKAYSAGDAQRGLQHWLELADKQKDKSLARWMKEAAENSALVKSLLESVFGNSPYLSRLALLYPALMHEFCSAGPDKSYTNLIKEISSPPADKLAELMAQLRIGKGKLALLTAMADITGLWGLAPVTQALSDFAELALSQSIDAILRLGHKRGEITLPYPKTPSKESGIIVLGMGKLGGGELNYSSDIDLIIFYEPGKLGYKGKHTEQHFMNKLSHDLVNIMQERTAQGYVFRTDLRLRPDPASTPPAVTTEAAYNYYESVGQNWERAALIKARPVAGDKEAGEQFLKRIVPFIWRRSLDFASINDIHSIKRQMDSLRDRAIRIKGHNVKLGMGGIREIEFFVQIHQLIWGGREPSLRTRATCKTLEGLYEKGLINERQATVLDNAYFFLRTIEHRLQMVADEQTHTMPESQEGIDHIARFMGYEDTGDFEKTLLDFLHEVHMIYASSFKSAEQLGDEGNLVFTGVSHDPDTLETLRQMGYSAPETISEIVMGWHHGSTRATRTQRARELLTEMMPHLIKRLSETVSPDAAFLKFNEFLTNLPAGVQLFSLFSQNPHLLGLIADIMGSAPTLADHLSKAPELLDAVLYEDFYGALPKREQLMEQLDEVLSHAEDVEASMDALCYFRNEKQFQAGVQMLGRMIDARQAGEFLSTLADVVITRMLGIVTAEFTGSYGNIKDGRFGVIALGKLGSREMTFSSDIDLVFVYDVPDFETFSDGEKSFSASVYYNRLCQRFVHALSAMGRHGRLYEVDTRLRPSGKQGLLAVSTQAIQHYFDELAWTFEYMAFTKARVIVAGDDYRHTLETFIHAQLSKPRDAEKLRIDAADMRERIEKEHRTKNPWDIKYVRGGLMDLDFIAQYLLLLHAPKTMGARPGSAAEIFGWLDRTGRLHADTAHTLTEANYFLGQIFNMLRLCTDRIFDEATAPPGLKKLLVESVKEKDFSSLKARLIQVEQSVHGQYDMLLGKP